MRENTIITAGLTAIALYMGAVSLTGGVLTPNLTPRIEEIRYYDSQNPAHGIATQYVFRPGVRKYGVSVSLSERIGMDETERLIYTDIGNDGTIDGYEKVGLGISRHVDNPVRIVDNIDCSKFYPHDFPEYESFSVTGCNQVFIMIEGSSKDGYSIKKITRESERAKDLQRDFSTVRDLCQQKKTQWEHKLFGYYSTDWPADALLNDPLFYK